MFNILVANTDKEDNPSIALTGCTEYKRSNNFFQEGKLLAQWLAWNSTRQFMDGFLSSFPEEYAIMCGIVEENDGWEKDENGFPKKQGGIEQGLAR